MAHGGELGMDRNEWMGAQGSKSIAPCLPDELTVCRCFGREGPPWIIAWVTS